MKVNFMYLEAVKDWFEIQIFSKDEKENGA